MTRAAKLRSGFTLIELLIVVGIISLLVLVLTVAVMPRLLQNQVRTTEALLQRIGGPATETRVVFTVERFQADAGEIAGWISRDEKIRSSQMLTFYLAPSREVWERSSFYRGEHDPKLPPDTLSEFMVRGGEREMPYIVDPWGNPIWYVHDAGLNAVFLVSAGPDGIWSNDDDLIYDSRNNRVAMRRDLAR
jgi:prepilin-type N-terminal cleavage/methylation domain-containing protein